MDDMVVSGIPDLGGTFLGDVPGGAPVAVDIAVQRVLPAADTVVTITPGPGFSSSI